MSIVSCFFWPSPARPFPDFPQRILQWHGLQGARVVAESHAAAIDLIERISHEEHIDCGFERVDGYLFAGRGRPLAELESEAAAIARVGIPGAAFVGTIAAHPQLGPAIHFPRQAQFHPLKVGTRQRAAKDLSRMAGKLRGVCRG